MRHRKFESLIDAYICNELPEKEQAPFEEHMLACKSCREKLLLNQAIADGIKVYGEEFLAVTSPAAEPSLAQRIRQRIRGFIPDVQPIPAAVSLILIAAIGLLLYGLWPRSPLNTYIRGFFSPAFKDQRIGYYENKYGVLDPQDPRSLMAHAIFKRLTQASGEPKAEPLTLVVLKDCPEMAISLPDGHIVIGDGTIERCRKILKDPSHVEAGLALIQGHEISHFLNGDFWMHRLNEFIDPKSGFLKVLRIKDREMAAIIRAQEHSADIRGALLASIEGYDVSPLLKYDISFQDAYCDVWIYKTSLKGIKLTSIDRKAVLIEAGSGYTGSTSEGIRIGDPVDKIYSNDTYGRPLTTFWCLCRQVILYPELGVGFEVEENRVRGWFLFERSGL